ncbi:DUF4192 family protein [Microbacterium karelineae]|uniref:DUF4192 family protein n=1 Tax=Microbacterium karelineae TaxID=2654283 RepID=UPI0012EAEFFC|nr:DUF4192 family protein [Microbacterium karelineae]
MPQKIRAASSVHLLALLPHVVGYTPRESLLLVPLVGGATCGALRIDLPRPGEVEQVAATAIGHVLRLPDVEAVVAVVYTDGPVRDGTGVVHEDLVAAVADRADACGLRVVDELCVGSDGWAPYATGDVGALSDIAAADPEPDRPVARAQDDGIALPPAEDGDRKCVARHLGALAALPQDAFRRHTGGARPAASDREIDAELAAFDDDPYAYFAAPAEEAGKTSAARAAAWMWILRSPALRDVVLTLWAGTVDEATRACAWQRQWLDGEADQPDFPVRLAGEGPRPRLDRLRRAREFVRELAARAPRTHVGVCLAVCAWLSWATGNATHAAAYAARAIEVDPAGTLPRLIAGMTNEGILPAWAYDARGAAFGLPPARLAAPETAAAR